MNKFDKEFMMEMFLDTDSTTTMNRLVTAIADVVTENSENIDVLNKILATEQPDSGPTFTYPPNRKVSQKRRKVYYDETVMNFTDQEFYDRFQMRRCTVQTLVDMLQALVKPDATVVPLDKKVNVFLYLLTSDLSYNEIGTLFGLHKSSVSYIFHEIATVLAEQRFNYINWPSVEEQHITRIKVNSHFKFPNCVGFIDACNFKIGQKSKKDKPQSIALQAVCDESLMFIDVHVGEVGITKKSKLFKDSPLSRELKNFLDLDNHILGDSQYKLRKNLITPFTTEEVLTNEEMKFNEIHWKARSYIGHAFELLKERFWKLNHIDITKPEAVKTLLYAACVLHNFVLLHEGSPQVKDEPVNCDDGVTIDPEVVKTAEEKRQFLCNYINYIDST